MKAQVARHRVLIVDDAPTVRAALRWALEDESDLDVVGEAVDGVDALRRAAELLPDVVILDVEMPALDGYAVTRALKAAPDPPIVVFLTVHADPQDELRGIEAGGDAFVSKASGWPALLTQIKIALTRPDA